MTNTPASPSAPDPSLRKAAWILAFFAIVESSWVLVDLRVNGWRFIRYLGFAPGAEGAPAGWVAAALVAAIYTGLACRLPSVRAELLRPSWLKALALVVAVSAGVLEEVMFRRWVINYVQEHGYGVPLQVIGSGIVFGFVHAIWGLMGGKFASALGAMLATGLLGGMLGIVFVLSGRSLAPCVAAHFLINAFIEPGLVLAATRGEMNRGKG